jgi:hypothetical protein
LTLSGSPFHSKPTIGLGPPLHREQISDYESAHLSE